MTPLEEAVKRVEAFIRECDEEAKAACECHTLLISGMGAEVVDWREEAATQVQLATDLRLLLSAVEGGDYVLVPREPTEKMLKAAFVAMNETPSGTWKRMKAEGETPRRMFDVKMAPRYRAMIDARPLPPAPTGEGGEDHSSVGSAASGVLVPSRVAETNREPETGEG